MTISIPEKVLILQLDSQRGNLRTSRGWMCSLGNNSVWLILKAVTLAEIIWREWGLRELSIFKQQEWFRINVEGKPMAIEPCGTKEKAQVSPVHCLSSLHETHEAVKSNGHALRM